MREEAEVTNKTKAEKLLLEKEFINGILDSISEYETTIYHKGRLFGGALIKIGDYNI